MDISINLASRGRPESLVKTLDSCINSMNKPERADIWIKIDGDDVETAKAIEEYECPCSVYPIIGPQGRGYLDMHLYINSLLRRSSGYWQFGICDDTEFITHGWDNLLCNAEFRNHVEQEYGGLYIMWPKIVDTDMFVFMAATRKVFETLGHWGQRFWIDGWLGITGNKAGINMVNHQWVMKHLDVDDDVRKRTYEIKGSAYSERGELLLDANLVHLLHRDADRLIQAIGERQENTTFNMDIQPLWEALECQ